MRKDENSHVKYPQGSVGEWKNVDGVIGCAVYCVAMACKPPPGKPHWYWHHRNFQLEELPDEP